MGNKKRFILNDYVFFFRVNENTWSINIISSGEKLGYISYNHGAEKWFVVFGDIPMGHRSLCEIYDYLINLNTITEPEGKE